jgi:hypothetical protein
MLSHVSEPSVLMLPDEQGWSLLHLQYAGRMRLANVEPLQQIVAGSFGLSATVLRCVSTHTTQQQLEAVFWLENHAPGWIPPAGWRWVTREALAELPLAVPAHRAVLETCLAEVETATLPALRAPWARRGWLAQAQDWIAAQLARLDYVLVPPLIQVRNWGISCVLRVRTFTGDLYLKAASTRPLFAREAVLVQEFAARYPAHMPLPVAVEPHQNWLLLEDVGPDLRSTPDSQVWTLAQPLGALHQAISYMHIVAGLEATAKHELAWGIAYWLRKVLQFLEPENPAMGL